jgi:hypothetical protein
MAAQCLPDGQADQEPSMTIKFFSLCLPAVACGLAISLGGCMAVPLAQMALSQAPAADRTCAGCVTNANAGKIGDLTRGVTDSLRKWAGDAPAETTAK